MPIVSSEQRRKAMMPRLRLPGGKTPHKRDRVKEPKPTKADDREPREAFDEDELLASKQKKEKHLAERARIAAEREGLELAARQGELVTLEAAQRMLEKEHATWLAMIDDWRQAINKRLSKLGIPVETQEAISDMVTKETTIMRQKRAVSGG